MALEGGKVGGGVGWGSGRRLGRALMGERCAGSTGVGAGVRWGRLALLLGVGEEGGGRGGCLGWEGLLGGGGQGTGGVRRVRLPTGFELLGGGSGGGVGGGAKSNFIFDKRDNG